MGALALPTWVLESSPVVQGVCGTLFTWLVTALGAAVVFVVPSSLSSKAEGKVLDSSLGFAAGVMLAASYWSLLAPAISHAENMGYGGLSFFPAAAGFVLGALFVSLADVLLPEGEVDRFDKLEEPAEEEKAKQEWSAVVGTGYAKRRINLRRRRWDVSTIPRMPGTPPPPALPVGSAGSDINRGRCDYQSWRRILLLVVAVTVHNFPEGLAVGVGFGAVGTSEAASVEAAEMLAFGIGIQNFPEGLAVSLPMRRLGYPPWLCFFYGQLSGMVEPLGGYLGAAAVRYAQPVLPYALAFAAGAMVYVVVDSIVPETQTRGNTKLSAWGAIVGFLVMMCLDVGLA